MVPPTLFCDACGAANQPQASFCRTCGRALQSAGAPSRNPTTGRLLSNHLLKQRYRILDSAGRGGMGAVYRAEDTQLGNRKVAIKEMSQSGLSPQEVIEAADAFKQEAHILAGLQHPNLPSIYDHFAEAGRWYLVMSFIQGETMEGFLKTRSGKLPVAEALQIGIQLCTVLDYLHTQQPPIIFRDLKPSNIMRTTDGHIYLIDFGIARHFKPGQAKDTVAYGSMGYASPEQYGKATTPRSDIYSLGAVLHQLLSGYDPSLTPFYFPPLQPQAATMPPALTALITQMLELDENKRPMSVLEIKQKFQSVTVSLVGTSQSPPTILASKPALSSTVLASKSATLPQPSQQRLGQSYEKKKRFFSILACVVIAILIVGSFLISAAFSNHGTPNPTSTKLPSNSITATLSPATQIPNSLPSPMPSPTPSPTPIPTPTQTIQPQNDTYEAESSANTLTGPAVVQGCSGCSGGNDVGYIGPTGGTLQFNNVNANATTNYMLTIYYCTGGNRSAFMSVNGGTATLLTFTSTNGFSDVGTLSVTINLNAGNNTIKFYNTSDWSPDIDKIAIIR